MAKKSKKPTRKSKAKKRTPAKKKPARKSATKKRLERKLEAGLEESFPGSDPVAVTDPTRGV